MIYFLNHYLYDLNHTLYNVHSCGESPRPVPLPEPSKNLWTPKETKGSLLSSSYRTWYYCLALVGRVQKCQNQPRGGGEVRWVRGKPAWRRYHLLLRMSKASLGHQSGPGAWKGTLSFRGASLPDPLASPRSLGGLSWRPFSPSSLHHPGLTAPSMGFFSPRLARY